MPEGDRANLIKKNSRLFWLKLLAIFLFLFFCIGFLALLTQLPENVVARGVKIGQFDLGGLTKEQMGRIISKQMDTLENQGVNFVYKNISLNLSSVQHSVVNPDISAVIFDYDTDATLNKAMSLGRTGGVAGQFFSRLYLRLFGFRMEPVYSFSSGEITKFLKSNLSVYETPIKDAAFKLTKGQNLEIETTEESAGKSFNYDLAAGEIKKRLDNLDPSEILLKLVTVVPAIDKIETEKLVPELSSALSKGNVVLISGEKKFIVEPREWFKWVRAKKENNQAVLDVDNEFLKGYLQDKVTPEIESDFEEAKFLMENGRVKEFKPGQAGQKINVGILREAAQKALFESGEREITLVTETVQPEMTLDKVNSFGIKELLGVGKTNFKGSPVNRRKNIATGAAALNGVLIAPGETFSTINRLKPIDDTNGYLPELVIKGNKTKPEFGGGLCQVSTTLFRAVLASGLTVMERAAHAYRVSYYEPPVGIDATIYDPAPDFKFLNDTGNYILVQSKIDGDNLTFEFWGTKDDRIVKRSDPEVYNIKAPPEPKLIETLDLPVGQKKCTEKAHAGADAKFDYIVTYVDGTVKQQEFKSKYRPWGEVCTIGVEKLSEPAAIDGLVSSTSTSNGGTIVPSPAPLTP